MSSKRKRTEKKRKARKRPRHNYSQETKDAILAVVGDRTEKKEENKVSVDDHYHHLVPSRVEEPCSAG